MHSIRLLLMMALMLFLTASDDSCDSDYSVGDFSLGSFGSLHPLYSEENLTLDPGLLGSWLDLDTEDTLTFEQASDHSYLVSCTSGCGSGYRAHLVTVRPSGPPYPWGIDHRRPKQSRGPVGQVLVLDVLAVLAEDSGWPTAPLHWFVRVRRTENKLELASLDYDGWLDNLLTEKPSAVMHTRPHGGIVLTASTEELQTFITANLANAEAFGDSTVYMRLEPGAVVPAPDGLR